VCRILIFPNLLCKSLLKKYTAIDNKILYFLHLNKSLGVYVLGKHRRKNTSVGESVKDVVSHAYVICSFYMNVFIWKFCYFICLFQSFKFYPLSKTSLGMVNRKHRNRNSNIKIPNALLIFFHPIGHYFSPQYIQRCLSLLLSICLIVYPTCTHIHRYIS